MARYFIVLSLFILCITAVSAYATSMLDLNSLRANAVFINNAGEQIGTAELEETSKGVLITLELGNLGAAGERAFHIHEKGACSPVETFKDAGGHYNPHGHDHGFHHGGSHAGDMPNLIVDDKGGVHVKVINTFVTLSKTERDGRAPLFDDDGSAFMIHAGVDDYASQPSGAAGARIACGVILPKE